MGRVRSGEYRSACEKGIITSHYAGYLVSTYWRDKMSGKQLQRSTPERQGVRSEAILNLIKEWEQMRTQDMRQDIHSFMLLRHGYVIAEGWWAPYDKEMQHAMFSLSKSFTSTAIGFAVSEGLLSAEDKVAAYFIEECPEPTGYLAQMRIKDLLIMSTGQEKEPTVDMIYQKEGDWVKAFFETPVTAEPGKKFLYNSGATYILSVIVQKVTGQKMIDYLEPRLFTPLGIENPHWNECPKGFNTGGFGMWLRTEDIAKFGQLYLNKGVWEEKQLLPVQWIKEATGYQIDNTGDNPDMDWCQGYGYQFWRCCHGAYRGDGAYGQFCIVMPEQDMVLVTTAGMCNTGKPMEAIWKHLLPGVTDKVLSEDRNTVKLKEKLASLQVLLPLGSSKSEQAVEIEGKKFTLDKNTSEFDYISFSFGEDSIRMSASKSSQKEVWNIGIGYWIKNDITRKGRRNISFMTGIWQDKSTLLFQSRLVETPYAVYYKFTFLDGKIMEESKINLYFDDTWWDQDLCW